MSGRVELSTPALPSRVFYRAPRLRGILGRDWKVAIPFVLPMALIMIGLILWPFIDAILLSTTTLNFLTGETVNVGLRNFERLPANSDYLQAMGNTIRFTGWSLAVKFVAGMTIALILDSKLPFRRLLSAIIEKFDGGPVGLDTLAASTSEDTETIEDVYEPYLLQLGFIARTPRGRIVTRFAYQHLGLSAPGGGNGLGPGLWHSTGMAE